MSQSDLFVVGAEVAIFSGREEHVRFTKIAKVYANGNFITEGDENRQQFSPSSDGFAAATGDHWIRSHARLLTPKVRERAEQISRRQRWRHALYVLDRVPSNKLNFTEDEVQALETVAERMTAKKDEAA